MGSVSGGFLCRLFRRSCLAARAGAGAVKTEDFLHKPDQQPDDRNQDDQDRQDLDQEDQQILDDLTGIAEALFQGVFQLLPIARLFLDLGGILPDLLDGQGNGAVADAAVPVVQG